MVDNKNKIHFWKHCHHCKSSPIVGLRYECQTCPIGPNVDLCSQCFELYQQGKISHPSEEAPVVIEGKHHFSAYEGETAEPFYSWLEIPIPESHTPTYPKGFLVRPEFCFGHESSFAGYGFVVNTPNGVILLTALHVLDEVLKKNKINASIRNHSYTGRELPSIIDKVNLYDVLEEKWMFYELGRCKKMFVLSDARIGAEEPISSYDICAFLVADDGNIQPGVLANHCPEVGMPVWLAAKSDDNGLLRKAVVVEASPQSFIFRYESSEDIAKYSSGAPILNEHGQVVAINIGTGKFQGQRFGHANHIENIHKHLMHAK